MEESGEETESDIMDEDNIEDDIEILKLRSKVLQEINRIARRRHRRVGKE